MQEPIFKKVGAIYFGVLSPSLIKKMAATKVVTPELYDKEGYPVDGGLMDVRMGVIDPGLRCKTCGGRLKECLGHFGYIELARPVIHIKYVDVIHDLLRCTCRECGRILADESKIKKFVELRERIKKEGRQQALAALTEEFKKSLRTAKKCPYCGAKQYNIKLEKPLTFIESSQKLNPIEVRARLEKITDDDAELLGLNPEFVRPEWLVLTVLPVPPVTVRPSITLETGERSEDDLTHKLSDIVRINQRLFENINAGAPEVIIEDLWELLQYHVTTYFDNSIPQIPPARHRSGHPLNSLTDRIKSKEGRFRYNLAGKRVNYAARTVVSPDPRIQLNEVGIPLSVAMTLTVPETVTPWNKEWLKKFVENGPKKYPGANYIIKPNGVKKQITEETKQQILEELDEGYIVERHLLDGDISIFNRQPSLHRMNIMCHKIRVLPGNSFRLNPAVCKPYNADFDGDEMNLHVPQTEEARAEAEMIMQVQKQIITPKNGTNIIGCIEDAVAGLYLLTKELSFTKKEAIQLLVSAGIFEPDKFKKFKQNVSGKEVFSALLPDDFDFVGKAKDGSDVIVKKGKLVEGVIDKNSVGDENGALIRAIYSKYKEDIGLDLLGKMFRLGNAVLLNYGFTTTISDLDIPASAREKINEIINEAEAKAKKVIKQYESGELTPMHGRTLEETVEAKILEILNNARNEIGNLIIKYAKKTSHMMIMALSGSKGGALNFSQMAGCVGQQALANKRIEKGFKTRNLPIFKEHDLSPEAKGWVRSAYREGLKPYEYFFHVMTGRDSLMDVALRTPKSGYLYRRLANALQDLRVEYDNTVRDASRNVVQFSYGEDGIDVAKSYGGTIDVERIIKEEATI